MDWPTVLSQGSGWVVALAVGWAVLRGDLRLGREVTERDRQIAALTQKLDSVSSKAEEVVATEHAATRAELAELRKTNAQMVARLSERPL